MSIEIINKLGLADLVEHPRNQWEHYMRDQIEVAMGLPGFSDRLMDAEAEAVKHLKGSMFSSEDVKASLTRLNLMRHYRISPKEEHDNHYGKR